MYARNETQEAAMGGDPEAVRQAVSNTDQINIPTEPNGFTPLHLACGGTDSTERQEIISILVKSGADLEARTLNHGLTPLQLASMRGQLLCVKKLIELGAFVNSASPQNGGTALHFAACNNHIAICKVLLSAGADVTIQDSTGGYTALDLARDEGNTEVYQMLSNALADVQGKNIDSFEDIKPQSPPPGVRIKAGLTSQITGIDIEEAKDAVLEFCKLFDIFLVSKPSVLPYGNGGIYIDLSVYVKDHIQPLDMHKRLSSILKARGAEVIKQ